MNSSETLNPETEGQSSSAQESSFGDILSEFEGSHRHSAEGQGQSRQGSVVAISAEYVFVDIGWKTEGVLPVEEFRNAQGGLDIAVGDQVTVSMKGRNAEGYYLLSKIKVERPKDWSSLEKAFQEKQTIAGTVTGTVKGGLTVDVGVRAFLPASRSGVRDSADFEKLIGQEIACKIIKLDTQDEDVVVDRRVVLEEEEQKAREATVAGLQEGSVVRGTVRSLTEYGAFVDLGGVDGLLHVADMAWHRVGKPADVLSVGESVEVKILKVDREARRISLGLKQLTPEPWAQAAEKYKPADRIRGKVVRVVDFGAFVELEPGVEGLIHLSDLSWSKKIRKPSDVVKAGELVEVQVLTVNAAEHRIGLGLKQALGDPWDDAAQRFPVGSVAEGTVVSIAKFGAFVELVQGVEAMIHIADLSAEKRINHPQEVLKMGEKVRGLVLEADREKRRIRLGVKQLQPTTTDEYIGEHASGDTVSGRIVEVSGGTAKVEVAEGVFATCRLPKVDKKAAEPSPEPTRQDVNSLSAMLAARWKGQAAQGGGSAGPGESVRTGQIRSFRISAVDPAAKRIELELAS